jgi:lipid-A-disaccharide synthase
MGALRVGLVAGEASGDRLGAALIRALRALNPDLEVVGVAGKAMQAEGCHSIADIDALSLMGVAEILIHLPRLLMLRRRIVKELTEWKPDVVVGIDAPDFNLGLERRLRDRGILTAHYVSPSVWAWRPGRIHTVARAAEAVLCLLPFEPACYAGVPVTAAFVGHPLADEITPTPTEVARRDMGLSGAGQVVAVLPGSRLDEVRRLAPSFFSAVAQLARTRTGLHVIVPLARPVLRAPVEAALARHPGLPVVLVDGAARKAMVAADAVLAASGTATLEALLLDRPMVVAYRVQAFTAWLLRRAGLRMRYFSLPNLLAGGELVPELIQEEASVARITAAMNELLDDAAARQKQRDGFAAVRAKLGHDAARRAADSLLALLGSRER